jgi:hypothetical protein
LVDDDVFAESAAFLSADDRAIATGEERASRDPEREARVASAFERAKADALEEIRAAQASSAGPSRWRRVQIASGGTDSRWVGRTWSL